MDNSISINFGEPKHGWLPVDFYYDGYRINFDASDVLNDPIHELCETLLDLQDNKPKEIAWWLEPGAYLFNIEKNNLQYTLTIFFTHDLTPDEGEIEKELDKIIVGNYKQIIEPFINALKQFSSQTYEPKDWPFNFDIKLLNKLVGDANEDALKNDT